MVLHELEQLIATYGYTGLFFGVLVESFGVPAPAQTLLIVAAGLAGKGDMDIRLIVLVAWTGAVIGDNIGYFIGRYAGRAILLRYGRYIRLTPEKLNLMEAKFRRYGPGIVIVARFFDVLRQLNGVFAGSMEMPWRTFLICNMIGATLWVALWAVLAFYFGANVSKLLDYAAHHKALTYSVLAVGAAAVILFLAIRFLRRR
ncbi:MAG: DedA family protein [Alphaproteobacteria bacterium]|nr:DedA family protein [Alphaproteobacteria bacterium]